MGPGVPYFSDSKRARLVKGDMTWYPQYGQEKVRTVALKLVLIQRVRLCRVPYMANDSFMPDLNI